MRRLLPSAACPATILIAVLGVVLAVVLASGPALAATSPQPVEPPGDNSPLVAVVAFLVVVAVAGGMLFIANAYRKNNQDRQGGRRS